MNALYAAYLLHRGYHSVAEAHAASLTSHGHRNLEYLEWIEARWCEFEDANCIRRGSVRGNYRAAFASWLSARSVDHKARAYVEAA